MAQARAHNVKDAELHKQSLSPLCMVETNGRPGRFGMAAVILMDDQMRWNIAKAYSLMRGKAVFANSTCVTEAR